MRERLQERLESLKREFEDGKKIIAELEARQANLNSTLLRISGAIQVLEELMAQEAPAEPQSALLHSGA